MNKPEVRRRNRRGEGAQLRADIVAAARELIEDTGTANVVTLENPRKLLFRQVEATPLRHKSPGRRHSRPLGHIFYTDSQSSLRRLTVYRSLPPVAYSA